MVIKASAATEIRQLVSALSGDDDVRREAAIARLSVIGARAVDRLTDAYATADRPDTKVAILRALEAIGDHRAVPIARQALGDGGDVAVAAVSALRALLDADHAATAADALDGLVATALDSNAPRRLRLAAVDALRDVPGDVRARVTAALRADPDADLQARADDGPRDLAAEEALWRDAAEGRLPDAPGELRDVLQSRAAAAPLGVIQKLIDTVRQKEGTVTGARRAEWTAFRGALHQALALRGSRLAVYDLRETLDDARGPLPVTFLAALHVVGDESCLEPLAAAYTRAPEKDARWRHQVGAAFRAIATRERITRRHAAIKRIAARWPEAVAAIYAQ